MSTKNGQICHIIRYVERCEQFSFGGMPPSASILRTIEDISGEDEAKMQQSFNDYEKCSGISKTINSLLDLRNAIKSKSLL